MRKFYYLVSLVAVVFFSSLVFLLPSSVKASDPSYPDQGCANGVQNSGIYTWASQTPRMVFTPTFNWLNAVSVRIKGTNSTGTPRIEAQIWDWHSTPHRMLATHSVDLENRVDEYWQHITQSSQDLEPGLEYALILVPKNGSQIYWSATTNISCYSYSRGYAMVDGVRNNAIVFGFVTYGWYDPSNPSSVPGTIDPAPAAEPASNPSDPSSSSVSADPTGDNPPGVGMSSSSVGSSSNSGNAESANGNTADSATSSTPINDGSNDISALLTDFRDNNENAGGFKGFLANIISSPIMFYLFPVISFLFWAGVILLIIFLVRRRNKKEKDVPRAEAKLEEKKK